MAQTVEMPHRVELVVQELPDRPQVHVVADPLPNQEPVPAALYRWEVHLVQSGERFIAYRAGIKDVVPHVSDAIKVLEEAAAFKGRTEVVKGWLEGAARALAT